MIASLQHRHRTTMPGSSGSACVITRPTALYAQAPGRPNERHSTHTSGSAPLRCTPTRGASDSLYCRPAPYVIESPTNATRSEPATTLLVVLSVRLWKNVNGPEGRSAVGVAGAVSSSNLVALDMSVQNLLERKS